MSTYKPREFVSEKYSFEASAHTLRELITRKHHESQNNNKEEDSV